MEHCISAMKARVRMSGISDWDDLRVAREVAQTGSFTAAAHRLGIDAATVLRRMNALEERLGTKLFFRSRTGAQLTELGERTFASATRVLHEIQNLELEIGGRDVALEGDIVFSTTDDLARALADEAVYAFRQQYPGIIVNLRHQSQTVNLNEREADVVLRCSHSPPPSLIGRRLGEIKLAVYRAANLDPSSETQLPWLLWSDDHAPEEVRRFLKKYATTAPAMRSDSFLALQRACGAGLGLAVLPCLLADCDPSLVRADGFAEPTPGALWLLAHQSLRNTPRIRAFMGVVGAHIAAHEALKA